MKKPLLHAIFYILFSTLLLETGCSKKTAVVTNPPTVTTQDVMLDVTSTSAQSGGTVTGVGSSALTANGVCYSTTNTTPTVDDSKTTDPIITYSYTYISNITGLTANTKYYVRAYVTNAYGTGYGKVVSFTTSSTTSTKQGKVTPLAGNATPGYADGLGAAAQFDTPGGIAVDGSGNMYVADVFNNRIRKITPDGNVSTFAGDGNSGHLNGTGTAAEFYAPQGLAVDGNGNVYVADYGNNMIRKITPAGEVSDFAGNGTAGYVEGAAASAEFRGPYGLAFDTQGNLYVADNGNNMIRKITSAGVVSNVAGKTVAGYTDVTVNATTGVNALFRHPSGVVVDATGNIFVADGGNSAIRQITPAGVVTTVAGGTVQASLIGNANGIAIDQQGDLYITDGLGRVIELTSEKLLYVLAGNSNVAGFADGTGPAVKFNVPQGIAVDAAGNIYIVDSNNNMVRKMVVVEVAPNPDAS